MIKIIDKYTPNKFLFKWSVALNYGKDIIIEYNNGYLTKKLGLNGFEVEKIKPSADEWKEFWSGLNKIGLWSWKSSYENLNVLDGYTWYLHIISPSNSIKSTGENSYPKNFYLFLKIFEDIFNLNIKK